MDKIYSIIKIARDTKKQRYERVCCFQNSFYANKNVSEKFIFLYFTSYIIMNEQFETLFEYWLCEIKSKVYWLYEIKSKVKKKIKTKYIAE